MSEPLARKPLTIKKVSTIKEPKLNVLVYAPPGHGKTTFLGSAAKVSNLVILSAESGLLSLRKSLEEMRKVLNKPALDIDFVSIEQFEDIEDAYLALRSGQWKYDAVGMDSLTEIQKVCMDKILRDEKQDKARIQDWGTLNNRMVSMLRSFRDLDKHLIVTALASSEKDEETQSFVSKPSLQGKLQDTLAGYFDEVLYLHSREVKNADGKLETRRWVQTSGTDKIQAKDRSGCLPRECPADFAWIMSKIVTATQPPVVAPPTDAALAPSQPQESK